MTRTPAPLAQVQGLPVVFLGMRCAFSVPPLQALIAAGVDLRAVVVPGPAIGPPVIRQAPAKRLPLAGTEPTIDDLINDAGIPLLAIREPGHPDVVAAIQEFAPAVIVVACFPWLLPRSLRDLPPLGCLNVHPSLLPLGRGPEPLFWTFRRGEERTGTTIHRLTGRFDAGPIVRRQAIAIPEGIRAPALEQQLAELGGRLLVAALGDLVAGPSALHSRMQDERNATSAPFPTDDDLTVPTTRSARWAFNFVRGVAPLGHPLTLIVTATGEQWPIRDALAWEPTGMLAQPAIVREDEVIAGFRPGIVRFRRR